MKKFHRELRRALESLGATEVVFEGSRHLHVTFEHTGRRLTGTVAHSPPSPDGPFARRLARRLVENKGFTPESG